MLDNFHPSTTNHANTFICVNLAMGGDTFYKYLDTLVVFLYPLGPFPVTSFISLF